MLWSILWSYLLKTNKNQFSNFKFQFSSTLSFSRLSYHISKVTFFHINDILFLDFKWHLTYDLLKFEIIVCLLSASTTVLPVSRLQSFNNVPNISLVQIFLYFFTTIIIQQCVPIFINVLLFNNVSSLACVQAFSSSFILFCSKIHHDSNHSIIHLCYKFICVNNISVFQNTSLLHLFLCFKYIWINILFCISIA